MQKYAQYAKNIQKICKIFAKYMPKNAQSANLKIYAKYLQKIKTQYAKYAK